GSQGPIGVPPPGPGWGAPPYTLCQHHASTCAGRAAGPKKLRPTPKNLLTLCQRPTTTGFLRFGIDSVTVSCYHVSASKHPKEARRYDQSSPWHCEPWHHACGGFDSGFPGGVGGTGSRKGFLLLGRNSGGSCRESGKRLVGF